MRIQGESNCRASGASDAHGVYRERKQSVGQEGGVPFGSGVLKIPHTRYALIYRKTPKMELKEKGARLLDTAEGTSALAENAGQAAADSKKKAWNHVTLAASRAALSRYGAQRGG